MNDDRPEILTYEQAIARLPDGDTVHTFRGGLGMMIGADWSRGKILEAMREAKEIHVSGGLAQAMHHGLAIQSGGWLFIATKRAAPSGEAR